MTACTSISDHVRAHLLPQRFAKDQTPARRSAAFLPSSRLSASVIALLLLLLSPRIQKIFFFCYGIVFVHIYLRINMKKLFRNVLRILLNRYFKVCKRLWDIIDSHLYEHLFLLQFECIYSGNIFKIPSYGQSYSKRCGQGIRIL